MGLGTCKGVFNGERESKTRSALELAFTLSSQGYSGVRLSLLMMGKSR